MLACGFRDLVLTLLISAFAMTVSAHSGSTAFIELRHMHATAQGEWLLALRDLEPAVGIDADQDGRLQWGELQARAPALLAYAQANLHALSARGECPIQFGTGAPVDLDGLIYWRWPLSIRCADSAALTGLRYTALFAQDTTHRAIVKLQGVVTSQGVAKSRSAGGVGQATVVHVLSPQQQLLHFDAATTPTSGPFALLGAGVTHILEGYDHLLFLLALLVPIIFLHKTAKRVLVRDLLKVITAFTVGHSITLAIATLSGWSPPSRWVEAAIAATVIVAGINIARPLFRDASWRMAALFGLIHDFGFASALRELDLPRAQLALSLLNFNLGVEGGQLLVVALAGPLLVLVARLQMQLSWLRRGASWSIVTIGGLWLAQRIAL